MAIFLLNDNKTYSTIITDMFEEFIVLSFCLVYWIVRRHSVYIHEKLKHMKFF